MRSPDIALPPSEEIIEDKSNGNGYWMFLPHQPQSFAERVDDIAEYGDFPEGSEVALAAAHNGSVLVGGAPGAGKSHLVRELQEAAVINNVPTFCLTTHINAGKRTGIENISGPLEEFKDVIGEGDQQGLVILDNADYLGYKGHRRPGAAKEYAQKASAAFVGLLNDPNVAVIGTAHDDQWREARWAWNDPEIDVPSQEVLENFGARMIFEGKMSLVGLAHLIRERELSRHRETSLGITAKIVRELNESGRARFFFANHIEPEAFLENPESEVSRLEEGRQKRTHGS